MVKPAFVVPGSFYPRVVQVTASQGLLFMFGLFWGSRSLEIVDNDQQNSLSNLLDAFSVSTLVFCHNGQNRTQRGEFLCFVILVKRNDPMGHNLLTLQA